MAHHLMKEDGQEVEMPPKAGTTPKKKEAVKSAVAPVNKGIAWVASDQFPSDQRPVYRDKGTPSKKGGGLVLLLQNYPHPLSLRGRSAYHFPTLLNT